MHITCICIVYMYSICMEYIEDQGKISLKRSVNFKTFASEFLDSFEKRFI